ncbi:MAG: hypothetical protein K0S65_6524 [Labilithrix sp.]|nr:hypothetical protein [Labilithrix sp.]
MRRRHVARERCALGGGQRHAPRTTQAEEIAVDGLGVEPVRLVVSPTLRRAFGEAERDERLRADLSEALPQHRLSGVAAMDDILRLGHEEGSQRHVLGLECRADLGAIDDEAFERRDGAERIVLRPGAAKPILEPACEELRGCSVRREPCGFTRSRQGRLGIAGASCRLRPLDEHLAPKARLVYRDAR